MSDEINKWNRYYDRTRGLVAHDTLVLAMKLLAQKGHSPGLAVDVGCGDGRDSIYLLKNGWRVFAFDKECAAIERLREMAPASDMLSTRVCGMEDADWPRALLINAGLSLPFCDETKFPSVWQRVIQSLEPEGKFCGHFFGERDSWVTGKGHVLTHTVRELNVLLKETRIEFLKEVEWNGIDGSGSQKHWHIWKVVATRK